MRFRSIPQPDEIYRFRSVASLIGEHKELYRQTIYLARPDQLNDVAEDAVNVVWKGDTTLWTNLITYYWRSLVSSTITSRITLPGYNYILEEGELTTLFVESEAKRLAEIYKEKRVQLAKELSQRNDPVNDYTFQSKLSAVTPHYIRALWGSRTQTPNDFPRQFTRTIGKMLFSEWGVACFTKDFSNPFLWTTYADNNAGVCLVFDRESLKGIQPPEHTLGVELDDVKYQVQKPEVEFFSNLSKLTVAEYKPLFTDENGNISPLCPFLPEDKIDRTAIFEKRVQISRDNLLTKQKYWELEQEVRMFSMSGVLGGQFNEEPSVHTVQYPIEALKGIIFGSRTSDEDKQAILEVILAKHYASPIQDDFLFMIADHRPDGSVWRTYYDPYISWQDDFTYPRLRIF